MLLLPHIPEAHSDAAVHTAPSGRLDTGEGGGIEIGEGDGGGIAIGDGDGGGIAIGDGGGGGGGVAVPHK